MPNIISRLFSKEIARQVNLTTGLHETDNNFYPGSNMSALYRDRFDYDRQTILAECLRAWRVNPIARRIVKLISMFIIGEGLTLASDHKATHAFLQSWWKHPLNQLDRKSVSFCDEATRSGNLFFLCTADPANGMLYVRGVPADQVAEIVTAENDVDQELAFQPVELDRVPWPAYDRTNVQPSFMLHYAFNQPVGVPWGEPDLAPMLPWIGRYSSWLEDRARLNRFRFAWLIIWKKKWESEAAKLARQRELAANPPPPGSWLLLDETETVEMPSPNLESGEAEKDGLALKKMIALGAGIPPHYLAEPESSTRTTAEAAGTPTFRGLEQMQKYFLGIFEDLAEIAVKYRKSFDSRVNPASQVIVSGPDITERDNSLLSLAVSRIYPPLAEIFDRGGIDEAELLRLVYRMAGEAAPPYAVPQMQRRPLKPVSQAQPASVKGRDARPTGEDDPAAREPPQS